MKKRNLTYPIVTALMILVLLACNLPGSVAPTPTSQNVVQTSAAKTVFVHLTQDVINVTQAVSTAVATAAAPTLIPSSTPYPTYTPFPTIPPPPPATFTPIPSPTPIPCNRAEFVKDVTVPDGTSFAPGATFTKTWRLKNTGSCTWTTKYAVVFVSGNQMGGANTALPNNVPPGQSVDASVIMIAPGTAGNYKGNWMLSNGSVRFGIGQDATKTFWVAITVVAPTSGDVYNFALNYCSANWENGSVNLPCPGKSTDTANGFVIFLAHPDLENRHEDEPTLWTQPPLKNNSWINGNYPAFTIKSGDHFKTWVGCLYGYSKCDVIFQLNYVIGSNPKQTLQQWHVVYDGNITIIDLDLSSLAGKSVKFVLTVLSNGSATDDAAFWLNPQIYRPAP
jgi:hypothetical protein